MPNLNVKRTPDNANEPQEDMDLDCEQPGYEEGQGEDSEMGDVSEARDEDEDEDDEMEMDNEFELPVRTK